VGDDGGLHQIGIDQLGAFTVFNAAAAQREQPVVVFTI
jgi:hypothetical protein